MSEFTCPVEGCAKPPRQPYPSTAMCAMHYARKLKYGSTDLPVRLCRHDGCSEQAAGANAKSCAAHKNTCVAPGCSRPRPKSRNPHCSMHLERLRRHGSLELPDRPCAMPGCGAQACSYGKRCPEHARLCVAPGCDRASHQGGIYCGTHKSRLDTHGSLEPYAWKIAKPGYKVCRGCREEKSVTAFAVARRERDGLQDRCRECQRGHRAANRDVMQAWREANRDRILAYNRAYEPRLREVVNARNAAIRARTVPFTIEQLEARFAYYGHRCWICRKPAEHADHVKPISAGGWHMLANLRPACARCNQRKNKTWPLTSADLERIRAA